MFFLRSFDVNNNQIVQCNNNFKKTNQTPVYDLANRTGNVQCARRPQDRIVSVNV